MYERFSDAARKTMQLAHQEAQRFENESICAEHVLLGLMTQSSTTAHAILDSFNVLPQKVRLEVEKIIGRGPDSQPAGRRPETPGAKQVIELAMAEARETNCQTVDTCHLLLGLLLVKDNPTTQILKNQGLEPGAIRDAIIHLSQTHDEFGKPLRTQSSPTLDCYGTDLGRLEGLTVSSSVAGTQLPLCPGRESELRQLHIAVNRATLGGTWLVGQPSDRIDWLLHTFGTELLAKPDSAPGPRRLVDLNFACVCLASDPVASVEKIAAEASRLGDVGLVIRHIDSLLLGSHSTPPGYLTALQSLASSGIPMILATTPAGCDQLMRREFHPLPNFTRLNVKPPDQQASLEMLRTYAEFLTKMQQVTFSEAIINELLRLTESFLPSQRQPGVGINILESIASATQLERTTSGEPGTAAASYDGLVQAITDLADVDRKRVEKASGGD